MKLSKKQIGLIGGLACAILLIVLLLTMCNGSGYGDHQGGTTESSAPAENTAAATEESTEASEETTEAAEETTEATEDPTEETEEATEETTAPTTGSTGGNTTPGGSGGYIPDYSGGNDSSGSSGAVTETAPAAGSEGSPYVENVAQFPDAFSSVAIPTDSTIYHHVYGAEGGVLTIEDEEAYVIYNGVTYNPDEYGVIQVPFAAAESEEEETPAETTATELTAETDAESGAETDEQPDTETTPEPEKLVLPQIFQLGSKSAEARSFLLTFNAPLGDKENPAALEAFDGAISMEAALEAGDEDGYYYSFTPANNGILTLQVESITENVACEIIVTSGDVVQKLSECEDGILTVNLIAEETILIQVVAVPGEDGTYPAAEIKILGQVEDKLGSKVNPIVIFGEFPIVTDVLEPETEVYYSVYGAGGMLLNIQDPDAYVIIGEETWTAVDGVVSGEVISANPREPVLIGVGNSGETAESYTVEFQHKLGTMFNPDQLVLDETHTIVIGEGATDGYWYTWTAEEEGILTLALPENNWMYLINNVTASVYGDTHYSSDENATILVETEVAAGDELNIMIGTHDPADLSVIPAGEIVFSASFNTKPGTKDNPLWLTEMETTVDVQPGAQLYCNESQSGTVMTVTGEGTFTVTYNGTNYASENGVVTIAEVIGTRFAPVSVIVSNYGSEAATYTISFSYPLGNSSNPQIIELMGEYTAAVKGNGTGYFYNWTAPSDGEFTVSMLGEDWIYVINNRTSGFNGDEHNSADGAASSETITVTAGDLIQINVSTSSGQDKDVSMVVDFYDPTYGTEENPVWLTAMENTVTVRAGATVYANVTMAGVTMTVSGPEEFALSFKSIDYISENGVVTIYGVDATRNTPHLLLLTNPGTEQVTYTVSYEYPLGSMGNPEVIDEMTSYTARVESDGSGYWYNWTAESDGVFVITMLSEDWSYVVNNVTLPDYGEIQKSVNGDPASMTFEVKAGDQIEINIGTSSGESMDVVMEFDAYDPTLGSEESPIWLTGLDSTVTVRPGSPMYFDISVSNATMIITGEGDFSVTYDGAEYAVVDGVATITGLDATRFSPKKLIITNSGEKKSNCTVAFEFPVGSFANPQILTDMGSYTAPVIGNSQGYFYHFSAAADGDFTVSMLGDDWVYSVYNLTSGEGGAVYYSDFGDPSSETVSVKAGEVLEINVGTSSRKDKDVAVEFTFQAMSEVLEILDFEGSYTPKPFEINLEEEVKAMGPVALTQNYTMAPSKAGIHRLYSENGPLVLLDFTDDTYVNLKELVESMEITIEVTAEDGTVTTQSCNTLLERYIECACVVKISDEVTRTLYPLTEDLELILKSLGEQLGWYDPNSYGYLFDEEEQTEGNTEAGKSEDALVLEPESLWMFACSYVEFIMEEETETTAEESAQASTEAPAEEAEETEETTQSEQSTEQSTEPSTEPASDTEPVPA